MPSFATADTQVAKRTYFYKSASLVRRGIVKLPARHPSDMDLLNLPVVVDRRILDWVVGLDTEISELVEGSNLYAPTVQMVDVVLHAEQKTEILAAVESFQLLKVYQRKHQTPGILQVLCVTASASFLASPAGKPPCCQHFMDSHLQTMVNILVPLVMSLRSSSIIHVVHTITTGIVVCYTPACGMF